MLTPSQKERCQAGLERLRNPILPLVQLAGMLYLTGPFPGLAELLAELREPVETGGLRYDDPAAQLAPYLAAMQPYERLKIPGRPERIIVDENMQAPDQFTALAGWVGQNVLAQELEKINSMLCGPCNCTLCCIGPEEDAEQEFFEIPLTEKETALFPLPIRNDEHTRAATPADDPPLPVTGIPFYAQPAALYRWRSGWSMILPRGSRCPQLDPTSGGCCIYPARPAVCRLPQIFPYILERDESLDRDYEGRLLPGFILRNKMLAVWDCPYVREFQEEIAAYAALSSVQPVFRENKG